MLFYEWAPFILREKRISRHQSAVMKNFPLSSEGVTLQFRAEFYNLFNHPNLYLNAGTGDVNAQSFALSVGESVPGVTASFRDSRQVVLALRLMF